MLHEIADKQARKKNIHIFNPQPPQSLPLSKGLFD
jgi:hypothetical protein